MHDVLRQRLIRKIESLPDEQIYQVLDYIEFLESKYAGQVDLEASGLQKFAEGLEDKLRSRAVSPSTIREAFQLISAADRVLSDVSSAGRQILNELNTAMETSAEESAEVADGTQRIEADPRKRRGAPEPAGSETPGGESADSASVDEESATGK